MILKVTTGRGPEGEPRITYLDHMARVQNHGPVCTKQPHEDSGGRTGGTRLAPYYFGDKGDLVEALNAGFGGDIMESFGPANVHLPELDQERPVLVTEIMAERDDGQWFLVCVTDDAFLMSDDGKTVDRLR